MGIVWKLNVFVFPEAMDCNTLLSWLQAGQTPLVDKENVMYTFQHTHTLAHSNLPW